jgi:hypothetical protein
MSWPILRASARAARPWKNGTGRSWDVATGSGTGPDGFDWRLSVALIERAGPFSPFAGYMRRQWLLTGRGMVLEIAGEATKWLDLPGAVAAFDGAASVVGRPVGPLARVLNLMSARPWPDHAARLVTRAGDAMLAGPGLLVAIGAGIADATSLAPEDALWLNGDGRVDWRGDGPALWLTPPSPPTALGTP